MTLHSSPLFTFCFPYFAKGDLRKERRAVSRPRSFAFAGFVSRKRRFIGANNVVRRLVSVSLVASDELILLRFRDAFVHVGERHVRIFGWLALEDLKIGANVGFWTC